LVKQRVTASAQYIQQYFELAGELTGSICDITPDIPSLVEVLEAIVTKLITATQNEEEEKTPSDESKPNNMADCEPKRHGLKSDDESK